MGIKLLLLLQLPTALLIDSAQTVEGAVERNTEEIHLPEPEIEIIILQGIKHIGKLLIGFSPQVNGVEENRHSNSQQYENEFQHFFCFFPTIVRFRTSSILNTV